MPPPPACPAWPLLQTGFYDNNKGLDYHIPVQGGRGVMPTLRVVHVAAEMAPIAKVCVGVNMAGSCGSGPSAGVVSTLPPGVEPVAAAGQAGRQAGWQAGWAEQ